MRAGKNPGDDHFQVNQGKLMQREVQTLRQNVSSLREFLHGCQDTINAETAKLEKECLAKIQSLENVRLDLERKCNSLNDEKKQLANASSNLEKRMRHLEKEVDNARKTEAQLRTTSAYLESKLEAKNNEFLSVRKDLERSKMKCLELENKVASNQVYVQEQREVLHEMASDHKQLATSTSSLEFRMAESEAYEKALEGHIAELEAICSILQEKHDEQQKYFLQKEVLYKKDAQAREDSMKTENKNLLTDIEDLKTKLKDERLKCDEEMESCRKLERRNTELEISTERLKEQLETTQDSLQVEKSTVEMLTQKNVELSQQLLHCQSEMRRLEEKNCDKMDKESMDRKALSDIGNTVQQYFEGNNMLAQKIQSSLLAQNKDKLSECEKQLAYERKRRLSAEIQAENLRVELEKAKVESAISRSRGNNSFVIKRSNSARDYMKIKTVNGPQVIENPNMPENTSNERNNDPNYSELLTLNPNGVPNAINLSEPVCNNSVIQDVNNRVNMLSAASSAIRLSSGNNHSFQNSSISISPRASQKMEEANKKALELLGGMRD